MSHRVFVYGTLKFPAIVEAVIGRRPVGTPATLDGYARYAVKRAPYPAMVPLPGEQVRGLIIGEIGPAELACIDDFEGELYRREPVTATTDDGDATEAYAYILRRRFRTRLADALWDEQGFAAHWHDAYVQACRAGTEPD